MLKDFNRIYALEIDIKNLETTYNSKAIFANTDLNTSTLLVKLVLDGKPLDVVNKIVTAYIKTGIDKNITMERCTILEEEEGVVGIDFKNSALKVGTNVFFIEIKSEDGEVINTPLINYKVVELFDVEDSVEGENDVKVLTQLITEVDISKLSIEESKQEIGSIKSSIETINRQIGSINSSMDEIKQEISNLENSTESLQTDIVFVKDVLEKDRKLILKYVHNSNKIIQPTSLDLETGIFTCVNHGLKNNSIVVPIQNNYSYKLQNIHSELFKTGAGNLIVTEVTDDTFKIKNTNGVINSFATTDNTDASIEKYHFEVLTAIRLDFVDIETDGDMDLKIYGYCSTGDMYVSLLKDGKYYDAINSFGAFTYKGAIALSSNATHSNFRPFFSTIQLRKTPIGYMFSHDLQQYNINNGRTITERTIPRRNAVIQYPYDDINGIRLGSGVHTWYPINGMTVEIYNINKEI